MQTAAVLPIKTFAHAKHRLAEAVGAPERRLLAEAMVGDVLEALGAVAGLGGVIVVTAEPIAAAAAREAGAEVVHDPVEAGQSAAAALGIAAAEERGFDRVLLVPGDCPTLDPAELRALLGDRPPRPAPHLVIVPDRHGAGTNALLIRPPSAVPPSFGEGSFARHAALGHAAGAVVEVVEVPSLGLDVDTSRDLAALGAALAIRRTAATRTRAWLERMAAVAG